jgi:hypothetical protein
MGRTLTGIRIPRISAREQRDRGAVSQSRRVFNLKWAVQMILEMQPE